jgi:hypothetical protein
VEEVYPTIYRYGLKNPALLKNDENVSMNPKLAVRIIIDIAMTLLMLAAFDYRTAREASHEWIGMVLFALFIVHNIINRKWYIHLTKGKYDFRRIFNTVVNLLLLIVMTVLMMAGLLQSKSVLAFLHLPGGMWLRRLHTTAAYWGLLLMGVHVGLHWNMIMNAMRNMMKISGDNLIRTVVLRSIAALITAGGIWAFIDRAIFSKLFQGVSFDFWNPERPVILFYAANFSIMGLFACITYYVVNISKKV